MTPSDFPAACSRQADASPIRKEPRPSNAALRLMAEKRGSLERVLLFQNRWKLYYPRALRAYFERYRRTAGITGYRKSSQRPCLRDLRATYAVHQIASWIRRKGDMDQMLPALKCIHRQCRTGIDGYLELTAQRFQNALDKLSPQTACVRWQDDQKLLEFLATL